MKNARRAATAGHKTTQRRRRPLVRRRTALPYTTAPLPVLNADLRLAVNKTPNWSTATSRFIINTRLRQRSPRMMPLSCLLTVRKDIKLNHLYLQCQIAKLLSLNFLRRT